MPRAEITAESLHRRQAGDLPGKLGPSDRKLALCCCAQLGPW